MLLKTDCALVGWLEIVGPGNPFTIHKHLGTGSAVDDMQQEPLLITTEHTLCWGDPIEATGGIGAGA